MTMAIVSQPFAFAGGATTAVAVAKPTEVLAPVRRNWHDRDSRQWSGW
ncbi:MAG: hypothetical protein ACOYNY_23245 [Caldilineaceae bacterium]